MMQEGELLLRQANEIVPSESAYYSGPGTITVSRNTVSFSALTAMSTPQINALIGIISALQKELMYGEKCFSHFSGSLEVPIQISKISRSHSIREVKSALLSLLDIKIVYAHTFDGMVTGVANLISAVECRSGRFYLTVSGKALPWFLFCGKNVGFARIELHVFLQIASVREKLLYLRLMSFVDAKTEFGAPSVSVRDLRVWLGYGEDETMSRINARVIQPLLRHLTEYHSRYSLRVRYDYDRKGQRGKPAIGSVMFLIDSSARNKEVYESAHKLLSRCWSIWQSHCSSPLNPSIILSRLEDNISSFLAKYARAVEKHHAQKRESDSGVVEENVWKANLIKKILIQDFGINVYDSGSKK